MMVRHGVSERRTAAKGRQRKRACVCTRTRTAEAFSIAAVLCGNAAKAEGNVKALLLYLASCQRS